MFGGWLIGERITRKKKFCFWNERVFHIFLLLLLLLWLSKIHLKKLGNFWLKFVTCYYYYDFLHCCEEWERERESWISNKKKWRWHYEMDIVVVVVIFFSSTKKKNEQGVWAIKFLKKRIELNWKSFVCRCHIQIVVHFSLDSKIYFWKESFFFLLLLCFISFFLLCCQKWDKQTNKSKFARKKSNWQIDSGPNNGLLFTSIIKWCLHSVNGFDIVYRVGHHRIQTLKTNPLKFFFLFPK